MSDINWKSTGIGAGFGALGGAVVGGLIGGPAGAGIGLVAGGLGGGAIGALVGKKGTNPGLPLYLEGQESPSDIYGILRGIYYDTEMYQRYKREEALPPDFLLPRDHMNYIIQRYSCGTITSRYHSRGKVLSIDSISLFCSMLPECQMAIGCLHAIPLTLLAIEYVVENRVSDEQLNYVLGELRSKHGPAPAIFSGEGLYRELEYYVVHCIADSVRKFVGSGNTLDYGTLLHAILHNHHLSLGMYLEYMRDEFLLDSYMMKEYGITQTQQEEIEEYCQTRMIESDRYLEECSMKLSELA